MPGVCPLCKKPAQISYYFGQGSDPDLVACYDCIQAYPGNTVTFTPKRSERRCRELGPAEPVTWYNCRYNRSMSRGYGPGNFVLESYQDFYNRVAKETTHISPDIVSFDY